MPLIINGSGPVAGTLSSDVSLSLEQKAAAIPSLVGVYDARDLPTGPVSAWVPRYAGAAPLTLVQNNAGKEPTRGTDGGEPSVRFGAATVLHHTANTWLATDRCTVALRFYLSDTGADLQHLYGFGGQHFGVYRTIVPGIRFSSHGSVSDVILAPLAPGWHDLIVTQDGTTATIEVFGVTQAKAGAGAGGTQFFLGNNALANPTSGGFLGAISRVIVAKASTLGTPEHQHVRDLLAS